MATSAGPNLEGVKNNDLLLSFDAHDAKSYPGEPTMNMIQLPNNLTNTGHWNVVSGTAANNQTEGPNGRQAGSLTASNSDPYIYSSYIFTVATGNLTFSAYVKGSGATIGMGGDIRINFGTSAGQATGSNTTSNYTITGDWQRVSVTATVTGAGTIKVGLEAPNSATAGQVVYMADIQLEQKAKATPFVVGPNCNDDGTYMGRPASVDFMLHGNVGTGTTFSDSGANALTITNTNSVAHSAVSKFNGESIKFVRASSQQLTTASTSNINFGTGDWTIDFWFNITNGSVDRMHALNVGTGNTSQISFNFNDGNAFWLYWNGSGSPKISFGNDGDYGDGQWHHLAATRYNGMVRVWVDGVHKGSNNYNSSTSMGQTASLYIGSASGGQYWDGYLDEVRVVKGTALWKGGNDFLPPTRRGAGGPIINRGSNNNAGRLLNGAGVEAAGSTTRRDGQVILPFSSAFWNLDGTDEYISIPQFDFTSTHSLGWWFNADNLTEKYTGGYAGHMLCWGYAPTEGVYLRTNGGLGIYMHNGTSGATFNTSNYSVTAGNWTHIIVTFDWITETVKCYHNGVLKDTLDTSSLGNWSYTGASNSYDYIDFGRNVSNNNIFFDGKLAGIKISNKILTAAQIKQNFNQQRSRFRV